MPHLLRWMGSTSPSLVQTTVEGTVTASLESASVIWDTQVLYSEARKTDKITNVPLHINKILLLIS